MSYLELIEGEVGWTSLQDWRMMWDVIGGQSIVNWTTESMSWSQSWSWDCKEPFWSLIALEWASCRSEGELWETSYRTWLTSLEENALVGLLTNVSSEVTMIGHFGSAN